ncbi:hypothetical protein C8R45DRAFT_957203 [Mycena sanguinolenta]|nr:hypothetical protein C8R45DRAFT_957203 [Mycena sanguinolenta]
MRRGGDDDSYGGGGEQRLPTRPSATHTDSWNTSAARVDEPAAPVAGGGGADEWSGTDRDAWGAPSEPKQDARAVPPAPQQQDAWAAPAAPSAEPKQDAWGAPAASPAEEKREAPAQDAWGAPPQVQSLSAPQAEAIEWEPTHDPWTAPAEVRNTSQAPAPPPPPPQSQSFHEEQRVVPRREDTPSANEWTAYHDPWASGGNQNQNPGQQQPQKQFESENKLEAPASVRGAASPFRDRINDNQTSNRSNEESFSANVLDVRTPSQASVAALAASRTNDMYDRSGPQGGRENDAPGQLPVEFNYFLHSETVDWLNSGPTNSSQNSFSPSQSLVTPVRELTPSARTATQSQAPEIKAPAPRNTDYFDYNQQSSEQSGDNWGSAGGAQTKQNGGADVSTSGQDNWGVAGGAQSTQNRSADVPTSGGDNWGASDSAAHRADRMQGDVDDSYVLGSMKSDRYESRQQDYHRRPSESQWVPSGGDDNRGTFDSFGSARGGGRGQSPGYGGRGGNDRDFDGGRGDYGGRGRDSGHRDDHGGHGDYGRGGGDAHDRSGDYGRGGGDRHDRGEDYGRRGGDEYGRGGEYGRRGGNDYGRRDGARRDDFDNGASMLNKYGGAGPLPTPYSGPPRRTSYGMSNFELPPLDDY